LLNIGIVRAQTGNSQPDADMILDRHTTQPKCRDSNHVESMWTGPSHIPKPDHTLCVFPGACSVPHLARFLPSFFKSCTPLPAATSFNERTGLSMISTQLTEPSNVKFLIQPMSGALLKSVRPVSFYLPVEREQFRLRLRGKKLSFILSYLQSRHERL
jgi:hypothetical protein